MTPIATRPRALPWPLTTALLVGACGNGDAGDTSSGLLSTAGGQTGSETGAPSDSTAGTATASGATSDASAASNTDAPSDVTGTPMDGSGEDTAGPPVGACGNAEGQLLPPDMPWNTTVLDAPVAADSNAVIDYLQANVDGSVRFQIDFSIPILEAQADTPRMSFEPSEDFFDPDCDPAPIPLPAVGHIEGESGYSCDNGGDCHLIVVDRAACRLYEQWRSNFGGEGGGGCLAIWSLDEHYGETMRGDYCSSADAAGLPIAPLLFTADEVAAGEIRHALRFILPNANIRADQYVRPGTHSTGPTAGPGDAPPYTVHLRLRPDVDTSGLNAAAQVVAEAMKTYGMFLADGGNITFTAASDDFTTATWDGVGLGPHDLKDLQWSDFEVLDAGPTITWSDGSCERTPITR